MRTIIVGAGIAGLWIAEQLALRGDDVTVLEKADYLGGRIVTSKLGYEIGAGRIATSHRRFLALIKRFGLDTHPLSPGGRWKALGDEHSTTNTFDETWAPLLKLFKTLDSRTLATHTLRELADKTIGKEQAVALLNHYGFRGETEVLRADLGIAAFTGEMGAAATFVTVIGGLTQIITGLADACKAAGVDIRLNTTVTDVSSTYDVKIVGGKPLKADRVILALPVSALKKLPCIRSFGPLRHLRMEPLTRIYAEFATPWCMKERLITDSPLRYIIPIIPELGIVMISYTEARDTRHFKGKTGLELVASLSYELMRLFPDNGVPTLLWAQPYEWADGCTYWLPGNYDPRAESVEALQPFPQTQPHLHLCNESFSLRQAWIEGSLEHAAALMKKL